MCVLITCFVFSEVHDLFLFRLSYFHADLEGQINTRASNIPFEQQTENMERNGLFRGRASAAAYCLPTRLT